MLDIVDRLRDADRATIPMYGWIFQESIREIVSLRKVNAELLEALQTVVANAPDPYCAITRAVDAQCRAAIAKATGE